MDTEFLHYDLLFFHAVNTSSHCFWPAWFLMRNQFLILVRVTSPWWVVSLFLTSGIFFYIFFWQFDYIVSRCCSLWVYSDWICWASWIFRLIFATNLGSLLSIFLQIVFLLLTFFYLLRLLCVYIQMVDGVPISLWVPSLFLFLFFP